MTRIWMLVFFAWKAFGIAILCAGEPQRDQGVVSQRVKEGFSFVGRLQDRSITTLKVNRFYSGRTDFTDPKLFRKPPEREGVINYENIFSSQRQIFYSTEVEPFPITPDSILIKVMFANSRETNINYLKSTSSGGISTFVDMPLTRERFLDFVANSPIGIWNGFLFSSEFPEVADFVKMCEWSTPQEQNQVSGFYKSWRVRLSFDPGHPSRPARFEVEQAAQGAGKKQPYAPFSRVIEFSDWKDFDGFETPEKLLVWDVMNNHKGEVITNIVNFTLEKVGPSIEVSDRLGDFFTDVPNGQPVQVNDYMGIDFIWQDGEIVRKIDRVKLASLIGQPFFGSPFRRYLMMALGLCVLAGVGWFIWRRPNRAVPPTSSGRSH